MLKCWSRVYPAAVSEVWGRPGHISKRMIVVNGISPGPTIEANFGDRIIVRPTSLCTVLESADGPSNGQVHVTNTIENATAIHWHGQFQNGTSFFSLDLG